MFQQQQRCLEHPSNQFCVEPLRGTNLEGRKRPSEIQTRNLLDTRRVLTRCVAIDDINISLGDSFNRFHLLRHLWSLQRRSNQPIRSGRSGPDFCPLPDQHLHHLLAGPQHEHHLLREDRLSHQHRLGGRDGR